MNFEQKLNWILHFGSSRAKNRIMCSTQEERFFYFQSLVVKLVVLNLCQKLILKIWIQWQKCSVWRFNFLTCLACLLKMFVLLKNSLRIGRKTSDSSDGIDIENNTNRFPLSWLNLKQLKDSRKIGAIGRLKLPFLKCNVYSSIVLKTEVLFRLTLNLSFRPSLLWMLSRKEYIDSAKPG